HLGFSTPHVESNGNLVWTSGFERCGAGVSGRGDFLSTAPIVFHTVRGERWELDVDKWVRALQRRRFEAR
ncbi:TPA: hypothetical protein ACKPYB_003510, partial [Stenotrophomonas maltophilia]